MAFPARRWLSMVFRASVMEVADVRRVATLPAQLLTLRSATRAGMYDSAAAWPWERAHG
ncbi:hypothetical protein GCM10007301_25990 [Azorhizobium oxalatiphilum]|uniref:Uncharacterized protein n=1 Tax=Azorhizobium oxalatiphilum TaxID=980631 RepID=A0A917C215_9HYPH|nr:hypothetical protein GCM10007301_25990 [Azorhizobium oxalatiphilum]